MHQEPEWRKLPHAEQSAGGGQKRIYKSRYDSVDCFISSSPLLQDKYNDIPLVIDDGVYARLRESGGNPCAALPWLSVTLVTVFSISQVLMSDWRVTSPICGFGTLL
jgi:hypothetical protein